MLAAATPHLARWPAHLDLHLAPRAGRTRLVAQSHLGPLRVQRAFHPEADGTAHVVVLHPPGGLVDGDTLRVDVTLDPGASALATSVGAAKIYRARRGGVGGRVAQHLRVADGATLEWVPQETLVFDGAEARLHTRIDLDRSARFLAWEVVCLGRPAAGEAFARGAIHLDLEVHREGRLRFVERGALRADGLLHTNAGLQGRPAFGTLVASADCLDTVRDVLPEGAAATEVSDLLVVRALGADATHVRRILEAARHIVRDAWGRPRVDPAVWRT